MDVRIRDISTHTYIVAYIELVVLDDLKKLATKKTSLKWNETIPYIGKDHKEVFKLVVDDTIVGLLQIAPYLNSLEIKKVEKLQKHYSGVGLALIAYACKVSIEKYDGQLHLIALPDYDSYYQSLGLKKNGAMYTSSEYNTQQLLSLYL
jgi:hypothetical protein